MFTETTGDICSTRAAALVVPVNRVGVMGKGVALAVRLAFPEVEAAYRRRCFGSGLRPGDLCTILRTKPGPTWVFCVATKDHWREPSQLLWVEQGLTRIAAELTSRHIETVALPRLGCGAGGLSWEDVRPKVVSAFSHLSCEVHVYHQERA